MNLLVPIPFLKSKTNRPRQVISNSWQDRKRILSKDVNLFCWERSLDQQMKDYLKPGFDAFSEPIVFTTTLHDLPAQLLKARATWDHSHTEGADAFWMDVYRLVCDFLSLSESRYCTLHLRSVDDNGCTKFHTDGYSLRLFTTYHGPGTEWLPEDAVNRKALGTSNKRIVTSPGRVQRMGTGHVGILKGELPGRPPAAMGIVHRSPAISHTGEKRIILRVDI